jgi:SAM-dependent methyltransferase
MFPWSQFSSANTAYADTGFVEDPRAAHSVIFALIGRQERVLEVGCSAGYFGEKLIKQKSCTVCGIDIDPAAIELARKRLGNNVFLSSDGIPTLPEQYHNFFDVIVCADVIEHTSDPWSFIRELKKYGHQRCRWIFSIPNIAHWSCRFMLLTGGWNYQRFGILDYTHLRFFTLRTAILLVEESQLDVCRVFYTSGQAMEVYQKGVFRILKRIDVFNLTPRIIARLALTFPSLFALQFVMECRRQAV